MIKKIATVLLLSLLGITSGRGQEGNTPTDRYLKSDIEQHQLDRSRWSDLTEGLDYTEKRRPPQRAPEPRETEAPRQNPSIFGEGAGAAIARFLLITLGAIAIALLVKSILGYGRPKNKNIKKTADVIDIQKIEEKIHEADLNDYIAQAIAAGDYTLAIRLYYLAILKELSLQKAIKWKVDKTNSEYLREMRQHELFGTFRSLTHTFERSWYGGRTLDEATFRQLEPSFQQFTERLNSLKNALTS